MDADLAEEQKTGAAEPAVESAGSEVPPDEAPAPAAPPAPNAAEIVGQVAWLMMLSPAHKHLFLADLDWRVVPSLRLRQFKLYHKDNAPVAFVSWAFVSEEVEERLKEDGRLRPGDWRSGEKRVIVDVVAPFGGREKFATAARATEGDSLKPSGE